MMSTAQNQPNLRDTFLGWQCRIRQMAIRQSEGRPTPAMMPEVFVGDESLGNIVTLIVKQAPYSVTPEFQHMVKSTQDPRQRREKALKFLASAYYQRSREFSDELTALFAVDSGVASALVTADDCRLVFNQYNQSFDLTCQARALSVNDYGHQTTFWHNSLFNPALSRDVLVIGFRPDWKSSTGSA